MSSQSALTTKRKQEVSITKKRDRKTIQNKQSRMTDGDKDNVPISTSIKKKKWLRCHLDDVTDSAGLYLLREVKAEEA